MSRRPSLQRVVVTQKMLSAGIAALFRYVPQDADFLWRGEQEIVQDILQTALEAEYRVAIADSLPVS